MPIPVQGDPVRSVPFTITSLFAGLGQCHGMVYDAEDHLRFEFQIKDSISGIIKSSVRQVRVPVTQIESVQLVKGLFGGKWAGVRIQMQAVSFDTFKEIPGMSHGKIELQVSKENASLAETFVNGLYSA